MRDDDRPDPLVVAALRRLGDQHEPDSDAIWARVDPARDGADAPVGLDGRRDRAVRARPAPGPRRPRLTGALAASLAAASVLGVLVVSQVVTRTEDPTAPATSASGLPSDGPTSAGTTQQPDDAPSTAVGSAAVTSRRPSSGGQSPSRTGSGPAAPRPSGPVTDPAVDGYPYCVPGDYVDPDGDGWGWATGRFSCVVRGSKADTRRTAPSDAAAQPGFPAPALVPLGSGGRSVSLTSDVFADWVAVGTRADGKQVRAKRAANGGVFEVTAPGGATVSSSPLLLSWSDGAPEQSRSGATTWLQGPRGSAWSITVDRLDVERRLVVLAGGAPATVQVDVAAPGRRSGRWVRSTDQAGSGPFSISLQIPAGAGPVTVTLTPAAQDGLAVSAVTLQRT